MSAPRSRALVVSADGGSRGNPGPAGYGAVVLDAGTGEVLAEVKASIGHATNNVAEYSGLIAGLEAAATIALGAPAEVRMDSKLVVEQMSGRWQIKHPDLRPLAAAARRAADRLGPVRYVWVPRERNAHADRLANEAMDEAQGQPRARSAGKDSRSAGKDSRSAGKDSRSAGKDFGAAGDDPAAGGGLRAGPGGSRSAGKSPAVSARQPGRAAAVPASGAAGWREPAGVATATILLRHGQTALSAERRFTGTSDLPLTQAGFGQAKAAAARIAARGGIAVIVTSPLRRARQTAAEVAAVTSAPVRIAEGLRETDFGKWDGLTFAEAAEQWPDEMAAWLADPAVPPPGGESFADTAERVGASLDLLLSAYAGFTLLLVSHVTPIKTMVARALLAPPAALLRMHLDVASLSEITWHDDGTAMLRRFNDTAHLGLA